MEVVYNFMFRIKILTFDKNLIRILIILWIRLSVTSLYSISRMSEMFCLIFGFVELHSFVCNELYMQKIFK